LTKSKSIFIILLVSISIVLGGCDLFSTRTPEEPNKKKSSFVPPTSASIVISNFINSITEKNVDNYIACLADTSQGDRFPFFYRPSSEASATYSSTFMSWNLFSERRYFSTLLNATPTDIIPAISLINGKFDVLSPDSAVFTSSYLLSVKHTIDALAKSYAGTLQLTIVPRTSGLWSIRTWYDIQNTSDSLQSWSILKARLAN
jgi:hypothetical protein